MRTALRLVLFVVACMVAVPINVHAVQPNEIMADPAQEARARALSRDLRCMVCQNQSIDDSDADLARDLRLLVREHIAAGDTDEQVIDFLVARYGKFVLLKPRFESHTWLLWLLPLFVLLGGGALFWRYSRLGPSAAFAMNDEAEFKLSPAEESRLAELIASQESPEKTD